MRRLYGMGALLVGAIAAGCGSSGGGGTPDSGVTPGADVVNPGTDVVNPGTDVVNPPTDGGGGGTDVPRTDVPRTDGGGDAGPSTSCGRIPFIDLNMMGMRSGSTTTIDGSNMTSSPMMDTAGPLRATTNSADCMIGAVGQLVYRYTTGSAPAILRVSTTNDTTPRDFDTMVWVFTGCPTGTGTAVTNAVCNDDDPEYAGSGDRRVSSLVTTALLPPNTTRYILVGGFGRTQANVRNRGPFRLTVSELQPVAAGGACRVDGRDMPCGADLTCVATRPFAETGTCRATGTAAGTLCRSSAPACDSGLRCAAMGEPAAGFCVETAMTGQTCSLFRACGTGQACVYPSRGSVEGTCRALGSAAGVDCRPMGAPGGQCDMGLQCDPISNECRTPVTVGMPCNVLRSICTGGATCIPTSSESFTGVCRANGTAAGTECRTGMTGRCDMGLTCRTEGTGANQIDRCITQVADGMLAQFDLGQRCAETSACYFTDFSDRSRCRCGAPGASGGSCNTEAPFCGSSLTCSVEMPTTGATGVCQTRAMEGARCEFPTIGCATGFSCVLNADSDTVGTCRADGSVAGAACAPGMNPCASGLSCNGSYLSGGSTCNRTVAMGAACDPLWGTTACPMGQVCVPTTYRAGSCAAATGMETEPNNEPGMMAGTAVTASTTWRGALPRGDQDCVAVTVAANGGVLAMVSDGAGACPARGQQGIVLDLYASDGATLLGEAALTGPDSCATIDGNRRGVYDWASGLSAGTYYVCARGRLYQNASGGTSITDSIASYVFTVAPLPPRT